MSYRRRRDAAQAAGFTLIELLVVLAIIATLAAIVGPDVIRNVGDAKTKAALSQIEMFGIALDAFRLDNSTYPTTDQGLVILRRLPTTVEVPQNWRGPYLRRPVPDDPWRRPYVYRFPGDSNPSGYDLYSLGRDGEIGGEGEDQDISSWEGLGAR